MSYSRFRGEPVTTETVYKRNRRGRVVRSVTTADPEFTDLDRGLVLALLAEQRETCQSCGHPMALCRDPRTAGTWQVLEDVCQPSRVSQAAADNVRESKRRGVMIMTRQI